MTRALLTAILLSLFAASVGADATVPTKDLEGAKDNPLLKRYEGSYIVSADQQAFDEFVLPLAALKPDSERRDRHNNIWFAPAERLELEGRITRLVYVLPEGRTPLEVVRNYQDEVEALGGKALFNCKREECGGSPERAKAAAAR